MRPPGALLSAKPCAARSLRDGAGGLSARHAGTLRHPSSGSVLSLVDHTPGCSLCPLLSCFAWVRGLEPRTGGFGDRCSRQLSYTHSFVRLPIYA